MALRQYLLSNVSYLPVLQPRQQYYRCLLQINPFHQRCSSYRRLQGCKRCRHHGQMILKYFRVLLLENSYNLIRFHQIHVIHCFLLQLHHLLWITDFLLPKCYSKSLQIDNLFLKYFTIEIHFRGNRYKMSPIVFGIS